MHIRCLQGSIFTSLSFSAQILHSWNVDPISQYNSYCSCGRRRRRSLFLRDTLLGVSDEEEAQTDLSDFNVILRRRFAQSSQIWVLGAAVGEQITATHARNTVIACGAV